MDDHTTDDHVTAPPAPTTMQILRWCVDYADQIFVLHENKPCRLCDLPDAKLMFHLLRFVTEQRLPHRVLRAEEVNRHVQ